MRRIDFTRIVRILRQHAFRRTLRVVAQTVKRTRQRKFLQTEIAFRIAHRADVVGDHRNLQRVGQRIAARTIEQRAQRRHRHGAIERFAGKGHGAHVRKLRRRVQLSQLGEQRHQRGGLSGASERDDVAVEQTHRAAILPHTGIVPARIPRQRADRLLERLRACTVAQQRQHMRINQLRVADAGRIIGAQQRQRRVGVSQHGFQSSIIVCQGIDRSRNRGRGKREGIRIPDIRRRKNGLRHEQVLQTGDVDVAHHDIARHSQGAGKAGGIALVLHIRLHTHNWHGIAMGADTESGYQHTLDAFRQQRAIRQMGG